jgi:hypothetical protein
MRHYLVTGGTGFIGRALCAELAAAGDRLSVLSRDPERARALLPAGARIVARLEELGDEPVDAVINLAGAPIADRRWSAARKRVLEQSRVALTRALVQWMQGRSPRPAVLVSASAIGFYGAQGDVIVTEQGAAHDEYQHRLCRDWEQAALEATAHGIRCCVLRIGLVIGPGGGFMQRLLLPFRLGLGGPIGNGRQWMSWIHRDDLLAMIRLLVEGEASSGVYNGTAPAPVTSREFAATLGRVLHRPAVLPLPAPLLRLALGEMACLLLGGQRVIPQRFLDASFRFRYPDLESALREVV